MADVNMRMPCKNKRRRKNSHHPGQPIFLLCIFRTQEFAAKHKRKDHPYTRQYPSKI